MLLPLLPVRGHVPLESPPDTLHPVIRTFASGDYDGSDQLWAVEQDERGLLYIAGQRYVRQFDGVRWRGAETLGTTNSAPARNLAVGPNGTVYAGVIGAVNVLRPDSTGTFVTTAVRHAVPDSLTGSREPFEVVASPTDVFVRTGPALWRVRDDSLHRVVPSLRVRGVFRVGDRVVAQRADAGTLVSVQPDGPTRTVLADPRLREYDAVAVLADRSGKGSALGIVVLGNGLFRATGDGLVRVSTAADALLQTRTLTDARWLSDETVAVATETHGALIVDPSTGRTRVINEASGLPSNEVRDLHVSNRGALWAATAVGLARISWPAPWTRADVLSDRLSPAATMARTSDGLYAGGRGGLFLRRDGSTARVTGIASSEIVFDAAVIDDDLLVTTSEAVYAVQRTTARRVTDWNGYGIVRSQHHPRAAYVGFRADGVGRLRSVNGRWQEDGVTRAVQGRAYRVAQDASEHLWVGTGSSGIYRLTWPDDGTPPETPVTVAHFDTTDGLPAPSFNFVAQIGREVRILTLEGLYRFDSSTGRFRPDSAFTAVYADSIQTGWPVEAHSTNEVWMDFGGYKFGVAQQTNDGTYAWIERPFRRLADYGDVGAIYPDGDSLVWVGTSEGVFRYDRDRASPADRPFRALVRSVTINPDAPDGIRRAYGGDVSRPDGLSLPYADNTLRLTFGATSYEQVDGALFERGGPLQFRYRLEGYDAQWSAWSDEAQKDYTGLPEGTYTFRVQARNLYNHVGRDATIRLSIAPPWYRTWWAYALYALGAAGAVVALVNARTRRLRARQRDLEATVAERTAEVRAQKEQLEQQAEELKELDEAKSRFFANLSHEFRTPLTLILGPVRRLRRILTEQDADALREEDAANQLTVVERNAHRLLRMVQQILNLARYDAGTLDLQARPTDLAAATTRITQSFVPLAERQALTLNVETAPPPNEAAPAYVDDEYLEQILGNLLSNAIKFTPAGGTVTVRVRPAPDRVVLEVQDTGPGIPAEEQARIFDRFTQADDTATRAQEGVGIGLALTHTLVDLHGGTLSVESTEGEGATFVVAFPRGRAHLADDQVTDDPGANAVSPNEMEEATPAMPPPTDDLPPPAVSPGNEVDARTVHDDPVPADEDLSTDEPTASPLVLVVDDNPDVRRYVRSVLAPTFRVREAATGTEGLDAVRETLPDVILADVMMPEMDGLTMTERLRADDRTAAIPIVMLTARAGTEDEVEGLSAGATDYVVKPFDPQVLEMRVRGTLAYQKRLRRRLLDEIEDADADPEVPATNDLSPFEREMRAVVAQHLPDPDFGVSEMADALAVSRSTLYRRAREADAPSPAELLRTMRLERGAELLRDDAGTVSEVAYAVGYRSLSHFSTQFADHFGQPPTAYATDVEE